MGKRKLTGIALEERLDEAIEKLKKEIEDAKKGKGLTEYLSNRTYSSRNGNIQQLLKRLKQDGKNTDKYDTQIDIIIDRAEEDAYALIAMKRIAEIMMVKKFEGEMEKEKNLTNYRKNKIKGARVGSIREYQQVGEYFELKIR
ncbi:MAG: hypothetical protein AABX16_05045 [Nanoarchaeota archaeon]